MENLKKTKRGKGRCKAASHTHRLWKQRLYPSEETEEEKMFVCVCVCVCVCEREREIGREKLKLCCQKLRGCSLVHLTDTGS